MKKIALSLALLTSSVFADTVVKSTDGLGDFLVAPFYMAKNNVCTKVTVYNTNTTESILAKVAFREQIASNEVDLPIFLSPGDVWSGTVCNNAGHVILKSNDDSNHPLIKNELAKGKDLTLQSYKAGNKNVDFSNGYIEIYPIAEFNEGSNDKVDKSVLVKRWDSLINGKLPDKLVKTGVDGYSLSGNVAYEVNGKTKTILPMKAFKGASDKTLTGSVIAYGNDTSPSVLLGNSKRYEILKLLQNKKTAFTYTNGGKDEYIVLTFPFGYTQQQVRKLEFTVRDMSENKAQNSQVVIFSPAPVKQSNFIKNEVAIISVAELISKTQNPEMFKEGQIQIKNIINISNVQLGSGKKASFYSTFITLDKNNKQEVELLNAYYTPVK
jgi:hypothetical protein